MQEAARNVIDKIPYESYSKFEEYVTGDINIYKPVSYISGMELSSSDYYHIVLPTTDPPPTKVNDREYQFKKGRLIVFEPETIVMSLEDVPSRQYTTLCIKKEFFEEVSQDAIGRRKACFSAIDYPNSSKLGSLVRGFEEEFKNYREGCPLMQETISTQIVIQILRETGNSKSTENERMSINRSYVDLAIEYMLAYYNANIKLEDICRQIHLSPYHFIRMFKVSTGKTPHEFLISVRIGRAEEMLRSKNYTIEETASLCGFVNTAHFSNCFKRKKGLTPSEYRKKY